MPPSESSPEERPSFVHRHIGPHEGEIQEMLASLGLDSLDDLSEAVVPAPIRLSEPLDLHPPTTEERALGELRSLSETNEAWRSFIGMGYHGCLLPPVIQRNILENPGWYTQYTPYQAEIAQGRLEALLNFQTLVADLTGLPLANASLLDEPTAAAEAMAMCHRVSRSGSNRFFASRDCHPQTLAVLRTRAMPLGIELEVGRLDDADLEGYFGCLAQTPATDGRWVAVEPLAVRASEAGCLLVVATDLLALTLFEPPGAQGADVVVGSSQRLGMPVGYGGPHAGFLSAGTEHERHIPGRIVGRSVDSLGQPALRLARQTREQHIRRERATSNICTAQVLPAVVASMYALYHGPAGLQAIGRRIHSATTRLAEGLRASGLKLASTSFFDTLRVRLEPEDSASIRDRASAARVNLRAYANGDLGVALDETVEEGDLRTLLEVFTGQAAAELPAVSVGSAPEPGRTTPYLTHPVFNSYHSEHELLRYMKTLEERDLSLTHSMIPLGSCTMKLNATAEMMPITWPRWADLHPYVPRTQAAGYLGMIEGLERWLAEITGFAAVSLQPNAGSQGEYAGLLAIRAYHVERGQPDRRVCLIPTSAHGTNPASAVMAGLEVVPVACEGVQGKIDLDDLMAKAAAHEERLAALMVTYPSTHGVFEEGIRAVCEIVHQHGGQVYLDGANMNALVGLAKPGEFGADVCHLNLHKTFCIPHGGGGPGMGPICVAEHLAPFLPADPLASEEVAVGPVSGTAHGSGLILTISWMYIALMGAEGLRRASQVAILNANYMARRLGEAYSVLYTRDHLVAHEFILDMRPFKASAEVTVDDIAKRLIDYGFHAPTMSWPVAGTMMVEPTESESKAELDRFCEALLAIREEIREIEEGRVDRSDNLLKGAPHTAAALTEEDWAHPYSRRQALFPAPWVERHKFWPAVGRVDNAFGDRNLVCTCPPMEAYEARELDTASRSD